MDINTTEYGVNLRETVFSQAMEQSVDIDFTLPDYCPNISRVLKCITTPVVISKSINGTQASVDGNITFCLIYTDEDNGINSYYYSYPFSKSFDIAEPSVNSTFFAKVKVDYMNIRAMSERKIEIHGAVGIVADISEKKTKNIISDIDCDFVYQKSGQINAITPLVASDKHIIVEEEIDIGQGKPAIKNIIKKNAEAEVTECKIISNKAVIKGKVALKVLYCPNPDGRPQNFETTMPFSQVIELNGVTDECKCDTSVDVVSVDTETKPGLSDECRTISVQAKLLLSLSAYCDNEVPVIFDTFSNKYEMSVEKEEVSFEKILNRVNENYICKKVLEFSDNAIGSVVDLWGDTYVGSVRCIDGKVTINGMVNISILGYDTNSVPVFYDRGIDFEYSFNLDETPTAFKCRPIIKAKNISYNLLDSNKIDIRADIGVNAVIYDIEKSNLITSVEVNEESIKKRNSEIALVLYYADPGEEVWDIAKKYNSSPKEISTLNELNEDTIVNKRVLLIP